MNKDVFVSCNQNSMFKFTIVKSTVFEQFE